MGHKVHPYGFRLGVSRTWTAKWYADKEYTALLKEDITVFADDTMATSSASCAPQTRRVNTSRPKLSVPSQCAAPGGR